MKKLFLMIPCVLLCMFLWGCTPKKQPVRVVTQINVTAAGEDQTFSRRYTHDATMSNILNYLRLLDPYIPVDLDPETFRSDTYEIIVTYSDGNHSVYRQIHQDYFQENGGKWKRIDPRIGCRLQALLEHLPEQI